MKQILNPDEISKFVEEYPTKYREGFTDSELNAIVNKISEIYEFDYKAYRGSLFGNTCMMIDGEMINYHTDVRGALYRGVKGIYDNHK